ncbi:MAG TPA: S8 family serine peptidase [Solirubrobacteraceae bacterium]|nr:S8 family serine peptidase [Solirubrobacteraceae bacterium]
MRNRSAAPHPAGVCRLALLLTCLVMLGLCGGVESAAATRAEIRLPAGVHGAVAPLPESDYSVSPACSAPAPGHARCLALRLVPRTAEALARTHPLGIIRARPLKVRTPAEGAFGMSPQDLHSAYDLPTTAPSEQTIALVDAYNDPNAEGDLKAFDEEFGLPECTAADHCFEQVNENGNAETANLPFPKTEAELETFRKGTAEQVEKADFATEWGVEISLDIETAHSICQSCHILLVEAESSAFLNLVNAERTATAKAQEVSNSYGGAETVLRVKEEKGEVSHDVPPFNHPETVITAAAGDGGYLNWDGPEGAEEHAEFPASSPNVVAVGGTRLLVKEGSWKSESVWDGNGGGGSGCSAGFSAPTWQQSVADRSEVGCGEKRAVADVSADAAPYSGVAVYDTSPECEFTYDEPEGVKHVEHWCTFGGTSLAAPLIAGVFALAGGAHGVAYPAETLYENEVGLPGSLHDITTGSNGECHKPISEGAFTCTASEEAKSCKQELICLAAPGYDGPTGVGTPDGVEAFKPAKHEEGGEGEKKGEEKGEEKGGKEKGGEGEKKGEEEKPIGGGESQPPGGGGGGSAPVSGGGAGSGGSAGSTSGSTSGSGSSPGGTAGKAVPAKITALSLTARAHAALARTHPRFSSVGFTFTISIGARVRVTLAIKVRRHGRTVWQTIPTTLTVQLGAGCHGLHLSGGKGLAPGVYRLTVTPSGGTARSLQFRIA